jgi:cytokinesis protein
MVIAGLESLSTSHNEDDNPFAFWFKTMEQSLMGRGKMGSLVGASEEVRRTAGIDSSMTEYTVRLLFIIITLHPQVIKVTTSFLFL